MHSGPIIAAPKARGTKGAPTTSLPGISDVGFHVRLPRHCRGHSRSITLISGKARTRAHNSDRLTWRSDGWCARR